MILLDTVVLSNFAHIERLDLLRAALPEAATTSYVVAELERGMASRRLPTRDLRWLQVVQLNAAEEEDLARVGRVLGEGEASCIAVAMQRQGWLFSDDRDARRYALRQGLRVSGTLGVLFMLIKLGLLSQTEADETLQAMIARGYRSPLSSLSDLIDGEAPT